MKKLLALIAFLFVCCIPAHAQQINWATNIRNFPGPCTGAVRQIGATLTCVDLRYQTVKENGVAQTQRGTINLLDGVNMSIVCADNVGDDSTDCTFTSSGGGGSSAFSALTSSTNTTATMHVGTGAVLDFTGMGVVNANEWNGVPITNTESYGQIPIGNGDGTATWSDPFVSGITAHDAVGTSTNPVGMGGYASAAAPTGVSADGDMTRLWVLRNGSPVVNIASGGTLLSPLTDTQLRATAVPVIGSLTNNNAAPGATNIGVLPAIANTASGTYTDGDQVLLSTDLAGSLRVNLSQAIPTGNNHVGNVGQFGPWSTQTQDGSGNDITSTGGALDVNLLTSSITLPVSGTVSVTGVSTLAEQQTQTTSLQLIDNIVSGSGVNESQIAGVAPTLGDVNNVAAIAGAQNVSPVARYNATQPTLTDTRYNLLQESSRGELLVTPGVTGFPVTIAAGSAVIGHVITDATSVTAATLGAETTKVIGTVRTADGGGNLLTTNSTTYTAKFGLDANLLGTLGTAFSTAGKVDVKGADGDVFVRQTTASNLHTAATLDAETTKVIGTVRNLGNAGGIFDTTQNATVPANALSMGCNFTTAPATITTGNQGAAQCNSKGELLTQITDGTTNVAVISGTTALKTDMSSIAGTATVTAGVSGMLAVGGNTANNVAITSNPVLLGAQGVSSENSAVTTARGVQLVADLVGKLIVLPYANPENTVNGTTAAITDTTSTSLIASAGGSLRNYVTSACVTNSHATVGTFVKILEGTNIIWEVYAAPAGGGACLNFPTPLRGAAATAINCQPVTTGANVICTANGYKGL